uniref:Uncharacterized protein n=1 Tax=Haptolina ericina TaxID=156174 RepID=A0A7S3AGY8_9EUKA|mmetsp:Transcript_14465/g.32493  ORF Transcript_14465/g.32493 Transcript_14465/m.32493 type:complete len:148 (+) Transcript_14465:291-734(+)
MGDPLPNSSARDALTRCALWAGRRVKQVMAAHGFDQVYIATDLRAQASGSYAGARRPAAAAALARLERIVPNLQSTRLQALVGALGDAGVRAGVEAAICIRSDLLLSSSSPCMDCARARRCSKLNSAFGSHLVARRTSYQRPSEALF